jgi:hypothetical protein
MLYHHMLNNNSVNIICLLNSAVIYSIFSNFAPLKLLYEI